MFDVRSPAFYDLRLLFASVLFDQTLTVYLNSVILSTSYRNCDSIKMVPLALDFGTILIFTATVKACLGDFYKTEHHELASEDKRVFYEDAFKCDRKEACKQFTTRASMRSNQPHRFDHELATALTKMPGMIIFVLLNYERKEEAFTEAAELPNIIP